MKSWVLAFAAVAIMAVVLVALVGVPYWISRGTFGRTFLDRPSLSIVAVNLSKNGTDCYIRSTVSNVGNIFIARLTLTLNNTYIFSDGWIAPNGIDDNWQRFMNYGAFSCATVEIGQTYLASVFSEFADGVNQTASKTLEVGQYPLPPPPS